MVSTPTSKDILECNVPVTHLENDADLRDIYTFGRQLGQGSFGVVYEATHIETQTKWAIKEVCRPAAGSRRAKMLSHEINILKQVYHAHIIHLQEVYHTAQMTYLVIDLCEGGDLKQLLQRKKYFTEDETRHIICSLADAVAYLHKRDIVHRDLKLENILVMNDLGEEEERRIIIQVADFGLSVKTNGVRIENMMTETCGTLIYMAPEVMSGRAYSQWCDVWSIGVVMYILLCGEPPFLSKTRTNLLKEIMDKEITFHQPIWGTVSDAAKNLLTCLLKADPAYRMSANQLLENPWITGDTNVPAMPTNVLDLMHDLLEQRARRQTVDDSPPTSFEGTPDPSLVPSVASTSTDGKCWSHTERDGSAGTPSTSIKPSPAGMKPFRHLSAKQQRPQDMKDVSTGQKPASELSRVDDQRPCTSSNSRTAPRKL
ncbi:serine/threonine-protein kinase 33-like [Pungitius pungitius]|uniref:serine/threonine-protein kinase 33-like n=1 Tax=Pungitius pungitius TaxID=134920 RepID=UPI001889843E|nr:serine/threonine-protein kinase 33-like [Pungitius pungitius]